MTETIVITGVGKRIGFALASNFLSQGKRVIGTYRTDYPRLQELRDAGAELYFVDFYQQSSVDAFILQLQTENQPLRALVHNASDWLPDEGVFNPGEVFSRMMQIHAQVPYQLTLALTPQLLAGEDRPRDIINITDYVAEKGSKNHAAYAASKAALANLSLSFAARLSPSVKVNSIAPSLILFNDHDTAAYRTKTLAKSALQREGGTQEMIAAVSYLMASTYVTGHTLHVNGGRNVA
jgi:dihydromonapterin reductase/dihydrofolate reductase